MSAETSSRRPTAVDLFAGAGGLALGFEQAGFDVVTAVEYDPVHAATHKFNFPRTEVVCGNIAQISSERIWQAAQAGAKAHGQQLRDGELDVIFGGPPCQGFSMMGKRLVEDQRNQLVFHFFRIIYDLKPRYFVMENVPGMLRGGHASILTELIAEFEAGGYQVLTPPRVLNAADFGVPQDRKRLILIGARKDMAPAAYPEPTVQPRPKRARDIATRNPASNHLPQGPSVRDAIGDLPDLDTFPELLNSDETLLSAAQLRDAAAKASDYAQRLRGLRVDPEDYSYPRVLNPQLLTSSTRTVHTDVSINRFRATPVGETDAISRFYRLDPEGLCNTLRAGTGSERGAFTAPRPIHPWLPRVLSNREAARLHSYPDWFRFHFTKWHGFRQIGNSVAPLLGRAIGAQIVAALGVTPSKPQQTIDLCDLILLHMTGGQAAEYFGVAPEDLPGQRLRKEPSNAAA